MASFVFNIAKGRVVELYKRVKSGDPSTSALILVPLETAGLETDAVLRDKDDLAAVLAGATNEQSTMGRKTLTAADLAALPSPDDVGDAYAVSLPAVTWSAASGNAISRMLVCYDADSTSGTDADIVPLTCFDMVATPDGNDLQLNSGTFYSAA